MAPADRSRPEALARLGTWGFGDTQLLGFYTTGDIGGTSERNEYLALGIQHNFSFRASALKGRA